MAPSSWTPTTIGRLGGRTRPAVKAGPFGSSLKKDFYVSSGYKIYGQEQVIAQDPYTGNYYIDEDRFTTLRSCAVEPGDILMSLVGTIGRVLVVPDDAHPGIINPRLLRLSLDKSRVNSAFMAHYLESDHTVAQLASLAQGGTMGVLNANLIRQLPILLPPIREQQNIADILNTWNKGVQKLQELLLAKRERKRGLMQVLLTGKKRFPRYRSSGAFRRLRLDQLTDIDARSLPSSTPADWKFRYVSLSDITQGRISDDLPTLEFSQAPSRARKLVAENDVLLATVRPNLQAFALVGDEAGSLVVSTGFAVLSARSELNPQYLYQYLFSSDITGQIKSVVTGSNYPAISTRDVRSLRLNLPTIEEQHAIATVLATADAEIENLEKQLDAYRLQKRGLMQQLLTGKKRVKVDELEAVA